MAGSVQKYLDNRAINDASTHLYENEIDGRGVNLSKFFRSYAKQYMATEMGNEALWDLAREDMMEALHPTYDRHGNVVARQTKAPSMSDVINLSDLSDYLKGRYTTTDFSNKTFDPHAYLLQQALNADGATDKFGNRLKVDGILGAKTMWALDVGGMLGSVGKGVTAYGATSNMVTGEISGKESNVLKNVSRTSKKKEFLPSGRHGGGFDGESRAMRDEYWSSKDMPYVSRILNGYPQTGDLDSGTFSDYDEMIINAGTFMGEESPLSRREKELYSEALSESVAKRSVPSDSGREVFIPEVVMGQVNGQNITLSPCEEWYIVGKGNYNSGVQKDETGRYKIAVGPRIINPDYPDEGKIWNEYDGLEKDVKIDVVLENKTTGETMIMKCVVDDYKAHTYSQYPDVHPSNNLTGDTVNFNIESGLIQTGIAYPESYNATKGASFAPDNIDSSVIEFAGSYVDVNLEDYTLVKLIVFDK